MLIKAGTFATWRPSRKLYLIPVALFVLAIVIGVMPVTRDINQLKGLAALLVGVAGGCAAAIALLRVTHDFPESQDEASEPANVEA